MRKEHYLMLHVKNISIFNKNSYLQISSYNKIILCLNISISFIPFFMLGTNRFLITFAETKQKKRNNNNFITK